MINKGKPKPKIDPKAEAEANNKLWQIQGSINEGLDVQLFVSATKLANLDFLTVSDPQCTLKVKEANNAYAVQKTVGETEVIDNNLNPVWTKHFGVVY